MEMIRGRTMAYCCNPCQLGKMSASRNRRATILGGVAPPIDHPEAPDDANNRSVLGNETEIPNPSLRNVAIHNVQILRRTHPAHSLCVDLFF